MQHEHLKIEIEGAEVDGLYQDLASVEVDLDDKLAGMFRLKLLLLKNQDGTWPYLDNDRFSIWKNVVITAGPEDGPEKLIDGYITHVRPDFGIGTDQCELEIWGMDASVLMDREEKLKDWPSKKDSDIAQEIFTTHGLTPQITDTSIVHDEQVSTIIQRETDMQFLKRLAVRNGYECFVDGDKGYFRPPQLTGNPQPVLAIHFGDDTNLNQLRLQVDALAPVNVSMVQIDRTNKQVLQADSQAGQQAALGSSDPDSFVGAGVPPGKIFIAQTVTTGNAEMTALCQGLRNEAEWFVTGEGEVAANLYGNILMPRATVTIKGVGETYSGVYFVTHVEHVFTAAGYSQSFRIKRNGLMPTGSESFSANGGGFF